MIQPSSLFLMSTFATPPHIPQALTKLLTPLSFVILVDVKCLLKLHLSFVLGKRKPSSPVIAIFSYFMIAYLII